MSLVISSLHLASHPFSAHPSYPGLVDPPRHAQETPHLREGNRCVPAADGMGTVQTQQVQACWNRFSDGIWSASKQRKSIRQRANISLQLSSTGDAWSSSSIVSLSLSHSLSTGLNVGLCCSGAPKTTEAAPTIPPGCSYIQELQTQSVDHVQ